MLWLPNSNCRIQPWLSYGSFFRLRREIDHLLDDSKPPRLVVYVPIERTETNSALIELDCAGVIMQPRQRPPACNTRLSVVARNSLKLILGEDQVAEIERQVESGKLSLADLNSLADKGKDISTGVLTLIFGSANPQEVALAPSSGQYDEEIGKKEAEKELRHLLKVSFDIEFPAAEALPNWRLKLGRHVLLTDLFAALKKQVPSSLSSVPVATSTGRPRMPAYGWHAHGETAETCGTAMWPLPTRSKNPSASTSLNCP